MTADTPRCTENDADHLKDQVTCVACNTNPNDKTNSGENTMTTNSNDTATTPAPEFKWTIPNVNDALTQMQSDLMDAAIDLNEMAETIREFDLDEEIEASWSGCTNGRTVAENIERLATCQIGDLGDAIENLADEYRRYDDEEMSEHIKVDTDEAEEKLDGFADKLEELRDAVAKIDILQMELPNPNTDGWVRRDNVLTGIEAALSVFQGQQDLYGSRVADARVHTVDDLITLREDKAKLAVWETASHILEGMIEEFQPKATCCEAPDEGGVDTDIANRVTQD